MGRGGAAFPTGVKWEAVAQQPARPHYLVCNADESEPGTFKDRVLLEAIRTPLIEAMTIAAYATNCEHGYLYLRGEYPRRAASARGRARDGPPSRLPGRRHPRPGILVRHRDPSRRGRVHLRRGDRDLQLDRGLPRRAARRSRRSRSTHGLFGKPTVVNNVETLDQRARAMLLDAGPAYARIGTEQSTGHEAVLRVRSRGAPGVYEVPFGETLGELLERAGGVPGGRVCRRCCWAAPPARSSGPTSSGFR